MGNGKKIGKGGWTCVNIYRAEKKGWGQGERGTNGMESGGGDVVGTVVGKKWKWSDGLEKVKGKERKEKAER